MWITRRDESMDIGEALREKEQSFLMTKARFEGVINASTSKRSCKVIMNLPK